MICEADELPRFLLLFNYRIGLNTLNPDTLRQLSTSIAASGFSRNQFQLAAPKATRDFNVSTIPRNPTSAHRLRSTSKARSCFGFLIIGRRIAAKGWKGLGDSLNERQAVSANPVRRPSITQVNTTTSSQQSIRRSLFEPSDSSPRKLRPPGRYDRDQARDQARPQLLNAVTGTKPDTAIKRDARNRHSHEADTRTTSRITLPGDGHTEGGHLCEPTLIDPDGIQTQVQPETGPLPQAGRQKKEAFSIRMIFIPNEKAFPQICVVTGTSCNEQESSAT